MPVIRIDDDVWEALKAKAVPLEDNPNTVLRRVLELNDRRTMARQSEKTTAQSTYRKPIMEVLLEMGGKGRMKDVLSQVQQKMKSSLKPGDYKKLDSGGVRWRHIAAWERYNMVQDGLLKADSHRGYWEITQRGRQELTRLGKMTAEVAT